jgi:hypothetical protein
MYVPLALAYNVDKPHTWQGRRALVPLAGQQLLNDLLDFRTMQEKIAATLVFETT